MTDCPSQDLTSRWYTVSLLCLLLRQQKQTLHAMKGFDELEGKINKHYMSSKSPISTTVYGFDHLDVTEKRSNTMSSYENITFSTKVLTTSRCPPAAARMSEVNPVSDMTFGSALQRLRLTRTTFLVFNTSYYILQMELQKGTVVIISSNNTVVFYSVILQCGALAYAELQC